MMPVQQVRVSPLEAAVKDAVSQALDDENLAGLLDILQADPLTTARYLRVANSPLFGRKRRVGSAAEAMDLLGRRAAAMIALVSSFDYGFSSRRRDDRLELARRHCLQTAVLARQLAGCCGLQRHADGLFVAGMLHDIASMLRPIYDGLWHCLGELSLDSALQSAELLSAWHLPHVIVDAVAELGRATGLNQPPDNESGRVLWVAHEFAGLVARHGESPADLAMMQRLLDADRQVVATALELARRRYGESGRFCQ